MTFKDLTDLEKKQAARRAAADAWLARALRLLQAWLFSQALDTAAGFIFEGGRLSLNFFNTRRAGASVLRIEADYKARLRGIAGGILARILRLIRGNEAYFAAVSGPQALDALARRQVLLSYGFDPDTETIIPGGYIDSVLQSAPVARTVAQQMNSALLQGMGIRDFRDAFRQAFAPAQGPGMLERHFARFTHDLFMEVDRAHKVLQAEELGLQHFVYAGTEVERTRDFCQRRMNRIYTVDFAEGWDAQEWAGKIPGKPVMQQMGGYNCRHAPMFISAEMAEMLAARRGEEVDTLGPARAKKKNVNQKI
jgi:hypothetical protein